jgi:biopolymer transport protein ExbB
MVERKRGYGMLPRLVLVAVMAGALAAMAGRAWGQAVGPAAPAAGAAGTQPAGIMQMILEHAADPIFIIIALLSVIGLTLIIQGFLVNRASVMMPEQTTATIREMIDQRRFKELIDFTETDPSFVSKALNPALKRAPSFNSMKEAMETAIGNLGPLLGLLGTVRGMIEAFSAMQAAAGNASPAQLAGGISTALTHTFLGLFLAVPCLAAFGILRTMVDRLTVRGALVAEDLLLMIKPADTRAPGAVVPGGAPRTMASPQPPARRVAPLPSPTPAS